MLHPLEVPNMEERKEVWKLVQVLYTQVAQLIPPKKRNLAPQLVSPSLSI